MPQFWGCIVNKGNYKFKFHDVMLDHVLKSPYILNNEKKEKDIQNNNELM